MGLNIRNAIAPRIKLRNDSDVFPLSTRLGVACRLLDEKFSADVDVEKTVGQLPKIYFGLEGWVHKMFALRAGKNNSEFTAGLGFRYQAIQVDYGAGIHELGISHRISLTYRFGELFSDITVVPPVFSPTGGRRTTVNFNIDVPVNLSAIRWQMLVVNEAGMVMKSFNGIGKPPASVIWDGRDDYERITPPGTYSVVLSLIDKNNRISTSRARVDVAAVLKDVFSPYQPAEINK